MNKPLPVWVLLSALQDTVHITPGRGRAAKAVRSKKKVKRGR